MEQLTERYLVSMGATPNELEHLRSIRLPENELAAAQAEAVRQHPEESSQQCRARAEARALWPHRPKRITPGHEWTLMALESVKTRKLIVKFGITIIVLLGLLVILGAFTAAHAQIDVIRVTDGGVAVTTFAAPFTFECGANLTCTRGAGTSILTVNASGGGAGCVPPAGSGLLLYDDGAGGCADVTKFSTNGTTTITGAATAILDLSAAAFLKVPVGAGYVTTGNGHIGYDSTALQFKAWQNGADRFLLTGSSVGSSDGQIPIWNNTTKTFVPGDPLVQGLTAHDAVGTSTNPVLIGGYASAAAPTDVSADGDATRSWVLRNGAMATVLTAAGALIGGDAANGLDVDVTRSALPTGASTLAEQQTQTTALQLIDDLQPTVSTDDTTTHATGTTKVLNIGAVATPTDTALNANDIGMPGMTNNRELYSVVRDAAGNARGANVDANNNLGVVLAAETTKVLGVTRSADGAGNLLTSNSTTPSGKFSLDSNITSILGTAPTAAGKLDVKGADGDVFVRQATAANLNATVVGTKTNNNAAPGALNFGTLPAVAQAAAPSYTEGNQVSLSTDLAGALRVSGSSGGGVAQTQVRDSANAWGDVGYYTNNLKVPVYSAGIETLLAQQNQILAKLTPSLMVGPFNRPVSAVNPLPVAMTAPPDGCYQNKGDVPISQTAATKLVSGISGMRILVCFVNIVAGAAEIPSFIEGTGSVCATGSSAVTGSTTTANGESYAANGGRNGGNGLGTVASTKVPGDDLCLTQNGSNRIAGNITYVYTTP